MLNWPPQRPGCFKIPRIHVSDQPAMCIRWFLIKHFKDIVIIPSGIFLPGTASQSTGLHIAVKEIQWSWFLRRNSD